ncbi:GerAB/ArcD/ProY family transporter [Effusibacillus lacus]|uniref:Spore germination protein n=1 Tax=Effusibacillus lacus TaxID=1348429 RepID=A0A292YTX6_9BACL|nr:endospore germination permease [Effusibacillus lacus]TCS73561.1 spore germination protein [Effusibacillus lacus]GAX91945.1 spore germination protein [Effusibacillus lacus]
MEFPREITVMQATAILISTIIGVGLLPLPRFPVETADTAGPFVTLLGILLAFVGLWLITVLGMRFPNQSIIRYSEDVLGKWAGRTGSVLVILFFAVLTALASREFGEVVITSVLRRTPLEVTVMVMLFLAVVSTRNDINVFAYIHLFYLPLILAPVILIIVFSMKNANLLNLQPILPYDWSRTWTGILTVSALFQGSFIHTIVIPQMRQPKKAMKASIWGMLVAGGLYLAAVVASLAVFGVDEIKLLLWPTLELAKTTSIPGEILERLDAAFLAVWVTAVFTTLFSCYFLTVHAISELFRLRDHRMFSLFVFPFVYVIAMLPQNVVNLYEVIDIMSRMGLWITIAYPSILLVVASIRKIRGNRRAGNQVG